MRSARLQLAAVGLLFVALTLAALAPVRSYDSFWHLATGRWIADHGSLPEQDPFAVASDRTSWHNGQWLFQVALYAVHRAGGITLVAWARAVFVAALFVIAFVAASRGRDWGIALTATAIGFTGAVHFLDVRPSTVAAFCVVVAIAILDAIHRSAPASRERMIWIGAYALLTIFWINVHPSALLAPLFAVASLCGIALPVVAAAALLVNPHGVNGVIAPLQLMSFVNSGEFVNSEWLPSTPVTFPLLYVAIAMAFIMYAFEPERRSHLWRVLILAALAYLALRHVRNQPLFFAALPLLVAPFTRPRIPHAAHAIVAAVAIIVVAATTDHVPRIDSSRFPVKAVARLRASGLTGNIYNPDQFGGFLIWSFYPQRRALTDGRNELYHAYIPEYAAARGDSRKWNALLKKYRIDLAVDEYRAPLSVIDARTRREVLMPASLAYFPRERWALIAWDEAAMVFARRAAFDAATLARWEITGVTPDAPR